MINKNTKQKTNPCGHTDEEHNKMFNPLLEKLTDEVLTKYGTEILKATTNAVKELEKAGLTTKKEREKTFKLLFPSFGTTYTMAFINGMKHFSKLEDKKIKIYE